MQKLIVIKHAAPLVDPAVPSELWNLSESGKKLSLTLAQRLAAHAPSGIISSEEPKAAQTAEIVAAQLAVPFNIAPGFQEHDRKHVPHMETRDFISAMAQLFQQPDSPVLGAETANAARLRFSESVELHMRKHPTGNVAIVTHGAVMALYIEQCTGLNAFQLWRQLGLPSFVALSWPDKKVLEIVDRIIL